jgi:hypothetical protein
MARFRRSGTTFCFPHILANRRPRRIKMGQALAGNREYALDARPFGREPREEIV